MTNHIYQANGRGGATCICGEWSVRLSDLSSDEDRSRTFAYRLWENHVNAIPAATEIGQEQDFESRLRALAAEISLGENFQLQYARDAEVPNGRFYFQIRCWRKDVITGVFGYGFGGKAYLSEHATDSELVQTIFNLYKGYWEHEARESFQWRGRRVFGPHIATEALWEVARRVDVRSAKHIEDTPKYEQPVHLKEA